MTEIVKFLLRDSEIVDEIRFYLKRQISIMSWCEGKMLTVQNIRLTIEICEFAYEQNIGFAKNTQIFNLGEI